jgi:6-phosphogluconolactonase
MKKTISVIAAASFVLFSCQKQSQPDVKAPESPATDIISKEMVSENNQNPDDAMTDGNNQRSSGRNYVYLESNDAAQNVIIVYEQQPDGRLSKIDQTNAGGKGAGAGLGSAGAIALDRNNELLFAVNAGSGSVSSFKIKHDGRLSLVSTESTHGQMPLSVTVHGQYVYAVNSTSADIFGFKVSNDGRLNPISGSRKDLSAPNATPAQISFSPSGHTLLVTEKGTNKISAFPVNSNGTTGNRVTNSSVGNTPFGFDFAQDQYMIVTNADGGNAGTSSVTSYRNLDHQHITAVNGAVNNGQSAICWTATTRHGRYAFNANTGSNTLTAYYVDPFGRIFFIPWATVGAGAKPADIVVSSDNNFVYNINGDKTVGQYRRTILGGLHNIGYVHNVPEFAAGLVSF